MNIPKIINAIYEGLLRFIPVFRVVWVTTVMFGLAMLIIALVLKKRLSGKKTPWVVGGIGLTLVISSGTQLVMSLFR